MLFEMEARESISLIHVAFGDFCFLCLIYPAIFRRKELI